MCKIEVCGKLMRRECILGKKWRKLRLSMIQPNRVNQHKGVIVRKERKGKIIGNPYISQKFCLTDKPIDDCSRFRHTIFFALRFNGRHFSTPGLSFIFFKGIVFYNDVFPFGELEIVFFSGNYQFKLSPYKFD